MVTAHLADFAGDLYRSVKFFTVLLAIASSTDRLANAVASKLIAERPGEHPDHQKWVQSLSTPDRRREWFVQHQDLLIELLVPRMVDQFLTYVSHLLAAAYQTRPEMLRSGEQVRIDDVMRYSTMEDFIAHLAEQKVDALAYKSVGDLSTYLEERLGFSMFRNAEERAGTIKLVELRNLIAHNARVANATYAKRVPDYSGRLGEKVPVSADTIEEAVLLLLVAGHMDELAAAKFGIARDVPFPSLRDDFASEAMQDFVKSAGDELLVKPTAKRPVKARRGRDRNADGK
jgi:hypothetical protein